MGSTTHKISKPGRSHGPAHWAGVPSASGEALTHSGKAFWCWDLVLAILPPQNPVLPHTTDLCLSKDRSDSTEGHRVATLSSLLGVLPFGRLDAGHSAPRREFGAPADAAQLCQGLLGLHLALEPIFLL